MTPVSRRISREPQPTAQEHQESLQDQPVPHFHQDSLPLERDQSEPDVDLHNANQTGQALSFFLGMDHPRARIHNIRDVFGKFQVACRQLILLTNYIKETMVRYHRAKKQGNTLLRYILQLRLDSLEGVRNMFYSYAREKAEILENLQRFLLVTTGIPWNDGLLDESFEHDIQNNGIISGSEMSITSDTESEDITNDSDESETNSDLDIYMEF